MKRPLPTKGAWTSTTSRFARSDLIVQKGLGKVPGNLRPEISSRLTERGWMTGGFRCLATTSVHPKRLRGIFPLANSHSTYSSERGSSKHVNTASTADRSSSLERSLNDMQLSPCGEPSTSFKRSSDDLQASPLGEEQCSSEKGGGYMSLRVRVHNFGSPPISSHFVR